MVHHFILPRVVCGLAPFVGTLSSFSPRMNSDNYWMVQRERGCQNELVNNSPQTPHNSVGEEYLSILTYPPVSTLIDSDGMRPNVCERNSRSKAADIPEEDCDLNASHVFKAKAPGSMMHHVVRYEQTNEFI